MASRASARFYDSAAWKALRAACLYDAGYTCSVAGCGRRAEIADHVHARPHSPFPTEADIVLVEERGHPVIEYAGPSGNGSLPE